ncbi:MAG: error-prone DNA polymerase, partial [Acidimicrobiales bacterium]
IRRRNGTEEVTYLHPLLERSLAKTLGIPLFQEQLMEMAIDVAGFSPGEADQLRQAMGSKRSAERMGRLKARFFEGMAEREIGPELGEQIWSKLAAFANFGFPESHSVSFAYLVYSSSWLKLHYPAAFCAGLLDAQPMGFWSPQTLVSDARRHGVTVLGPDVNVSCAESLLEADPSSSGGAALRLGISYVRGLGDEVAARVAAGRPYRDLEDLVGRAELTSAQAEALATAGALGCFGLSRREALWSAGAVAQHSGPSNRRWRRLPGLVTGADPPALAAMDAVETNRADLWALGLSPDSFPTEFVRPALAARGVLLAAELIKHRAGERVEVAGVVTHRQRPATAGGTVFMNLEDESGLVNVIFSEGAWVRYGLVARSTPALVVGGRLESAEGVVNLVAERVEALLLPSRAPRSRDFR